jgi:hypothetical protein
LKPTWFKSSYSSDTGGSCVEVANLELPHGPALTLPPEAFAAFVTHVRT